MSLESHISLNSPLMICLSGGFVGKTNSLFVAHVFLAFKNTGFLGFCSDYCLHYYYYYEFAILCDNIES